MERKQPTTLQDAILYFSDPKNTVDYLVAKRWPNGVVCPTCGSKEVRFLASRNVWECKSKHPKKQFSGKVGTIFEDSAIGLDKWFTAIWMIANCKNGVSSYELHRTIGVTQKSAWFMLHRIRLALQNGSLEKKMGGEGSEVEADETFYGGTVRNMHRKRKIKAVNSDNWGKTIVLGLLHRESGEVRAKVAPNRKKREVQSHLQQHVALGSKVFTDDWRGYDDLPEDFAHEVVDKLSGYVRGRVHTNGMENFWSCLKRSLGGTYVSVDPWHLFRYLDEQCFRFNNRKDKKDSDRFDLALSQISGKRLTYADVTGKNLEVETI